MAKQSKKPRDLAQMARAIVEEAVSTEEDVEEVAADQKDPAAVARGRAGGVKGGKARAKKLSPEERSAIAKRAADARWSKG